MKSNYSIHFLFLSLILLLTGLVFGVVGGLQYIFPELGVHFLSLQKTRPLHVSLVISWIFTAATGGIYYYLPGITGEKIYSEKLVRIHFYLTVISSLLIVVSYLNGKFGGREYLEYPPAIALIIFTAWILFLINYFKTITGKLKEWPVYFWMWSTGIIFFLITLAESYLWMIPYFRDNIIRDITIQWKSLGSMVGSWNMLVYGTSFYIMEKISGNRETARSPITFFFYFLGLTNLMFNWGHHTYIVPAAPWIKNVAYIISMTELLILGSIILNWRKTLDTARKNFHLVPFRFLSAADLWIFLNLSLAILISIPAINYYTHGTHITVAHAMGATIGINTCLLLASLFYIISLEDTGYTVERIKSIKLGFWIFNISFLLFWISLLVAGIIKSVKMEPGSTNGFAELMNNLAPVFHGFLISGLFLFAGLLILGIPLIRRFIALR